MVSKTYEQFHLVCLYNTCSCPVSILVLWILFGIMPLVSCFILSVVLEYIVRNEHMKIKHFSSLLWSYTSVSFQKMTPVTYHPTHDKTLPPPDQGKFSYHSNVQLIIFMVCKFEYINIWFGWDNLILMFV